MESVGVCLVGRGWVVGIYIFGMWWGGFVGGFNVRCVSGLFDVMEGGGEGVVLGMCNRLIFLIGS